MYGSLTDAALDFMQLESEEYCSRLILEINMAVHDQIIQQEINWKTCNSWWNQHDVVIDTNGASQILATLRGKKNRDSN